VRVRFVVHSATVADIGRASASFPAAERKRPATPRPAAGTLPGPVVGPRAPLAMSQSPPPLLERRLRP
jgi:hypothetical protein